MVNDRVKVVDSFVYSYIELRFSNNFMSSLKKSQNYCLKIQQVSHFFAHIKHCKNNTYFRKNY